VVRHCAILYKEKTTWAGGDSPVDYSSSHFHRINNARWRLFANNWPGANEVARLLNDAGVLRRTDTTMTDPSGPGGTSVRGANGGQDTEALRKQVAELQAQLQRLERGGDQRPDGGSPGQSNENRARPVGNGGPCGGNEANGREEARQGPSGGRCGPVALRRVQSSCLALGFDAWLMELRAYCCAAQQPLLVGVMTATQGDLENAVIQLAIRSAYVDDERFNNEAYTSQLHRLEGLWLTENGKVVVPNSKPLRQRVMRTMHDNQAAGHLGVSKTLDQVTRWFDWAGVSEDVRHYVRNCHSCQVNKASSLKPAGKLQPLPIPLRAWDSVSMDLIVKLPASGPQKYDSILVFVDRLTKMVHLVKTWESSTAPQYAKLFIEHVFRLHGMPRDVISDRRPQFKNHFWAEVAKLLRVQVNLSSAYHPQTDGQTERMNRVARLCLEKAQKRQKVYADGKRRHATFAPGDMVLLSTQNMRGHSAQPGVRKLKPRYVGPFEVQYMVGEAAVKLELPQQWSRFHDVFHVSLVKPYRSDGSSAVPGVSSPPPEQWLDGEPVYTVERVLDHRLVNTGKRKGKDKKSEPKKPRLEFLVKWQGYGDEHNTSKNSLRLDIRKVTEAALALRQMALSASASRASVTRTAGSRPALGLRPLGRCALRVSAMAEKKAQVIQPVNNDPFIGFLETPVTSAPIVANYLSSLPAYRTGVAPVVRGVEIGLAHGFFLVGPFIKFGPLRNIPGTAEIVGCLSGAGLVLILTLCLSLYGASMFQSSPPLGVKTLSGRSVPRDPLQTSQGWSEFTAGWAVGGLSGVAWAYICTQVLPYYN
ncbi:hypothetical protein QJQ45_018280, partial [Haematococcus lacustris]